METRDDHPELGFRQHRPRPAARPNASGPARRSCCGTACFVDSRSWGPLIDALARDRTVYAIDGPSHGKSEAVRRDFTFDELRRRRRTGAGRPRPDRTRRLGGQRLGRSHRHPARYAESRLRTLTTIGTPVQGFTLREKLTKAWPLVEIYRFTGPNGFIMKQLVRFAARRGIDCRCSRSRPRRSWRRSATPTARACFMRCGR